MFSLRGNLAIRFEDVRFAVPRAWDTPFECRSQVEDGVLVIASVYEDSTCGPAPPNDSSLVRIAKVSGSPRNLAPVTVGTLKAQQYDKAIGSFTDAITLKPDFAEAFRQRAVARYQAGDTPGAVADLGETVRLEPHNFLAYHVLADIASAREDWKAAYLAWQKVLEIDPQTQGGQERLRDLKVKAVGEDL